jgi:hypothetical protein
VRVLFEKHLPGFEIDDVPLLGDRFHLRHGGRGQDQDKKGGKQEAHRENSVGFLVGELMFAMKTKISGERNPLTPRVRRKLRVFKLFPPQRGPAWF